jgi:Histone-binding protein RBBP4 or subunit C of CAF1 complex
MSDESEGALTYDKEQYDKWKQLTPLLYDWFTNSNLTWPSLSCRWGRVKEEQKWKRKQLLYLSEQVACRDPVLMPTCKMAALLHARSWQSILAWLTHTQLCLCRPPAAQRIRW